MCGNQPPRTSPCSAAPSNSIVDVTARTTSGALYTGTFSAKVVRMCQRVVPSRCGLQSTSRYETQAAHSDTGTLDAFPSAMGVMTRLACARAAQGGFEVELLLTKAGLTRQQIDEPGSRVSVKSQIKFLELAATTLKDELLGFHLAQSVDLRLMGLLYYVLASSETLEEALRRGARYSAIVNEGIALKYREGRDVGIRFEYVGVPRHSDHHQIESSVVTLVRTCRQLTNRDLPSVRVKFTHRRSGDTSEFTTFFGSNVTFGATADEVTFSRSVKQLPVVGADPYLNELLIKYCDQALATRATKRILLDRVSRMPLLSSCHTVTRE